MTCSESAKQSVHVSNMMQYEEFCTALCVLILSHSSHYVHKFLVKFRLLAYVSGCFSNLFALDYCLTPSS
jgi:hypothetical protein